MSDTLRPDILTELVRAYAGHKSVLLRGPSISGRAQYFYAADRHVGRKAKDRLVITASAHLALEDFYGGLAPSRKGPVWRDGILAEAMRTGRRVLIHDVDQLPGKLRWILIDKLEGRSGYQGDGAPELVAKPGFAIDAISTGTPDPELVAAFAVKLAL